MFLVNHCATFAEEPKRDFLLAHNEWKLEYDKKGVH